MLRIRLRRVGKKKKPSYRIVVADANAPRDGAYVEWIGNYDPMADPPAITLKRERAIEWLSQGAQPSDAVRRILDRDGILVRAPKFHARAEAAEVALVPEVTITRGSAPAAVVEESVEEVAEEAVGEESADEITAQEGTGEEVSEESSGDDSEDEASSG